LTFAHRVLSTLKTDGLNSQLAAILHKQEDCNALLAAISPDSNLIPSDSGFSVKREFFEIPNPVSPSQDFEVQALAHFVKTENSEISHFPPPKWSGDFPHFLDDLLQKATPHLEKSLSYACPLPEELDLSRYCYEGGNPQFRSEVDESIDRFLPDAPAEFLRWAISIALSLIPRYEQRPLTDQSVGLMMFFRVIFDRVYERRRRLWLPDPHDEARILEQIAVLPTRLHEFPVNDLTPEELALPIRTYFKSAQFFGGAAEFLSEIVFLTNPIDALYSVHRALRLINKAALLKRLANKGSATETDLKKVLGFDDLFSLLVGVVLASDVPDFFEVAKYIDAFAPKNCLSNSFEFALAAVAALSVHFTSLNVDELRARLEP
jgi:hypothetical protein